MPAQLPWSQLDDAAIKRIYETTDVIQQRTRKAEFVARTNWRPKQVYFRAIQLGLIQPNQKAPNWSEAEDEFILENAGKDPREIRKALMKAGFYGRTQSSVGHRLRFLVGSVRLAKNDAGTYTGNEVARYLGVDSKSVSTWCRTGLLKAKPGIPWGAHSVWMIKERDIRRFVVEHTARVNFARCDKFWLVDLLVQHGAKGREAA